MHAINGEKVPRIFVAGRRELVLKRVRLVLGASAWLPDANVPAGLSLPARGDTMNQPN
jgi:hypothetical protein